MLKYMKNLIRTYLNLTVQKLKVLSDDVVDAWYKLFNSVLDEYLPQIQKRVKREVQPKWF